MLSTTKNHTINKCIYIAPYSTNCPLYKFMKLNYLKQFRLVIKRYKSKDFVNRYLLKEKVTPEIVFFFVIANKKFILS